MCNMRAIAPLLLLCLLTACSTTTLRKLPPKGPKPTMPVENLVEVRPGTFIGGQPTGTNAFHYLQSLGIKTLISVDGATPDVKTAKAYGMRYVHIPIGYSGIKDRERLSLIRASEEIKPPYLVHCHHGIHRAPTAAGIILMADLSTSKSEVKQMMREAGTSPSYKGLWESIDTFTPKNPEQTLPELQEITKPGELATAMADIDRHWDVLKLAKSHDWQSPPSHPDISLPHTGLLLHEGLVESQRLHQTNNQAFKKLFDKSIAASDQLHQALKAGDQRAIRSRFNALKKTCTSCHTKFRD